MRENASRPASRLRSAVEPKENLSLYASARAIVGAPWSKEQQSDTPFTRLRHACKAARVIPRCLGPWRRPAARAGCDALSAAVPVGVRLIDRSIPLERAASPYDHGRLEIIRDPRGASETHHEVAEPCAFHPLEIVRRSTSGRLPTHRAAHVGPIAIAMTDFMSFHFGPKQRAHENHSGGYPSITTNSLNVFARHTSRSPAGRSVFRSQRFSMKSMPLPGPRPGKNRSRLPFVREARIDP
jgi:hypothetical protein